MLNTHINSEYERNANVQKLFCANCYLLCNFIYSVFLSISCPAVLNHYHWFSTAGQLSGGATCCHSVSTSASVPVVLLHPTVCQAVMLQSGGTHHSSSLSTDTFKNTQLISLEYAVPLHLLTDIKSQSEKLWLETRYCCKHGPTNTVY